MSVGVKLAELRHKAHMSQFQLAKVLKVSTSTLGMYETGKREPSLKVLKRIADYFNVSTDYLLGRAKKGQTSTDLDEAIDHAMSFDGRPVTDHDRKVMKRLWKAYIESKD